MMASSLQKHKHGKATDYYHEVSKVCQPCLFEGKSYQSNRFCVECHEYLCKKCSTYHKALKSTRNHDLVTIENAKKATPVITKEKTIIIPDDNQATTNDICSFKCSLHTHKSIKYFCVSHSYLGCSVCITLDHKQCSIEYIPTVAEDIKNRDIYKTFDEKLKALRAISKACIVDAEKNLKHIATDDCHLKEATKEFRKKVNKAFDKLEKELMAAAEEINLEETNRLNILKNKLSATALDVDTLINTVDTLISSGKNCDIFVLMKKEATHLVSLNEELITLTKHKSLQRYDFDQNNDVLSAGAFGKLSICTETTGYCTEMTFLTQITDELSTPKQIQPGTRVRARHPILRDWLGTVEHFDERYSGWKVKWDNGIVFHHHGDDLQRV